MSMDMNRRAMLGTAVVGAAAATLVACKENPAPLAPSVTKADFKGAVAEMRRVVGDDWVFADTDAVIPFSKTYIPDPTHRYVPVGAVAPATVEEVQELVRIANKYKQPLWTVSTGKNMGYGMAAPATPGQMVLDLKRMNRILEVDPELGTALIEPGVTYQQLKDYLDDNNLPYWIDVPTVGPIAGPVGNTLDPALATRLMANISCSNAAWRLSCPMAGCCARAWAASKDRPHGKRSNGVTAPISTGCSPSRTLALSPKWGFG
jgi:4-cresol dehydrogenase (hydroxylating) flavoprotein subunit